MINWLIENLKHILINLVLNIGSDNWSVGWLVELIQPTDRMSSAHVWLYCIYSYFWLVLLMLLHVSRNKTCNFTGTFSVRWFRIFTQALLFGWLALINDPSLNIHSAASVQHNYARTHPSPWYTYIYIYLMFASYLCHTHIVAVQIQNRDAGESINEAGNVFDQVPAQVQFVHVAQFQDALWHRWDVLQAEVQRTFIVQSHPNTVLNHFQGHGLLSICFGHPAAERCAGPIG